MSSNLLIGCLFFLYSYPLGFHFFYQSQSLCELSDNLVMSWNILIEPGRVSDVFNRSSLIRIEGEHFLKDFSEFCRKNMSAVRLPEEFRSVVGKVPIPVVVLFCCSESWLASIHNEEDDGDLEDINFVTFVPSSQMHLWSHVTISACLSSKPSFSISTFQICSPSEVSDLDVEV